MLARRLAIAPQVSTALRAASTCSSANHPSSSSSSQGQGCKTLSGRGRANKGVSVSTRLSAAKSSRIAEQGHKSKPESHQESSHLSSPQSTDTAATTRGRNKKRGQVIFHPLAENRSVDAEELWAWLKTKHDPKGPILTSPNHSLLHVALTPTHLPLPIPLGVDHYVLPNSPAGSASSRSKIPEPEQWQDLHLGPFDPSLRASHAKSSASSAIQGEFKESAEIANSVSSDMARTGLSDHLVVMHVLGRPGRDHLLGETETAERAVENWDNEVDSGEVVLNRDMSEASARNRLLADQEWNMVLAQLGDKSALNQANVAEVKVQSADKEDIDNAVSSLTAVLSDMAIKAKRSRRNRSRIVSLLGPEGEDGWLRMDSTKRKRKKKMSKHKFQKRRKAQAAVRKKIGK